MPVGLETESYLSHRGVKPYKRFVTNTYRYITRAIDDHDVTEGRGRGTKRCAARTAATLS